MSVEQVWALALSQGLAWRGSALSALVYKGAALVVGNVEQRSQQTDFSVRIRKEAMWTQCKADELGYLVYIKLHRG